jgi:hypothetical protein
MKNEAPVNEQLTGLEAPAPVQAASVPEAPKVPTSMLNPEAQAYTNALVSEAIKGVFAQLGPMLQSIALTPEKLAEAERLRRAPDPAAVARELRERKMTQQDLEENERQKQANQSACPHVYPTGQATWHVVRNYPDRQPRFSCPLCSIWVTPREWRIGAPDQNNPRGVPYIVPEHPLYRKASEILATKG